MPFLHFDEAKKTAIGIVRTWLGNNKQAQAMLAVDLFGKLRLFLREATPSDTKGLIDSLNSNCGLWWTGQSTNLEEVSPETAEIFESLWSSARPDDEESRFCVSDRHRSRTAWFSGTVQPPWKSLDAAPIVVFYSFKGGLGRSTLLASFAIQRARQGERVCVLDFDLDSPGVGRLLSADAEGLTARWGIVDFLLESSFVGAPLDDYFHRCDRVAGSGEVVVFPAGQIDEEYPDKLARIDMEEAPDAHNSGLWRLLSRIRDELNPNWILLDARTGISEPAGQLLSGIAHLHVLLGTTQEQSWQGLSRVLDRLGKSRVLSEFPQGELTLVQALVPVGEPGKSAKATFAARAESVFEELYYVAQDDEFAPGHDFWSLEDKGSQDAPHVALPIDYNSGLASFSDISEVADILCLEPYIAVAERIVSRFLEEPEK